MNSKEEDTQILGRDELHRLAECVNAMQNSSGGIIKADGEGEVHVAPLIWYEKPIALDGRVWRRIEGQNVICGKWARSVMASRDSCDDFSVDASLNQQAVDAFRETVIIRHPELEGYPRDEFLRRTGIISGRHITSAGALMFGEALSVSAELNHKDIHAEIHASNIWDAYTVILPRLTRMLSAKSADGVRNTLVNALLHSEYILDNHINISVLSSPPQIVIDSPGIITAFLRNHRLARIFRMAGITAEVSHAEHDMLNFRTLTTINIEGLSAVML